MVSPLGVLLVSPTSSSLRRTPSVSSTHSGVLQKLRTSKTSLSQRVSSYVRLEDSTTLSCVTKLLLNFYPSLTGGFFLCVYFQLHRCLILTSSLASLLLSLLCLSHLALVSLLLKLRLCLLIVSNTLTVLSVHNLKVLKTLLAFNSPMELNSSVKSLVPNPSSSCILVGKATFLSLLRVKLLRLTVKDVAICSLTLDTTLPNRRVFSLCYLYIN